MARRLFSEAEKQWLRGNWHLRPVRGTLERFNLLFDRYVTYEQMKGANQRYRFGKAKRKGVLRAYAPREMAWLKEHLPTQPVNDSIDQFERKFGRRLTRAAVKGVVTKHGLRGAPNTGRFKKGNRPWTANAKGKGLIKPNSGQFQKGHERNALAPMYATRVRRKHGEIEQVVIKVPGPSPYPSLRKSGQQDWHWEQKARWVWEQSNGPIPEAHVIVHLDGDSLNCELENLECVSRGVLARMNAFHAPRYAGPEANPARLRRAQLLDAIDRRKAG